LEELYIHQISIQIIEDTTFGGKIYDNDFEKKITLTEIASRIESDKKFDKSCKLSVENKKKFKQNVKNI